MKNKVIANKHEWINPKAKNLAQYCFNRLGELKDHKIKSEEDIKRLKELEVKLDAIPAE